MRRRRSRSAAAQLPCERLIWFLAVDKFLRSPNRSPQRTPQTKSINHKQCAISPVVPINTPPKTIPIPKPRLSQVASGISFTAMLSKVKSATTASVAGQYRPLTQSHQQATNNQSGKLLVVANTREAIAATAAESNRVRRRPQNRESAKEPPKMRPAP